MDLTTALTLLAALAAWCYAGIVRLRERRDQLAHERWVVQHRPARWAPKTLTRSETRHAA